MTKLRSSFSSFRPFLFGSVMLAAMCGGANASIIYNFNSVTPVATGTFAGDFDWSYTAQLSADQQINTNVSSSFATIYDFLGVVSASTSASAPGLTEVNVIEFTSPLAHNQNPPDSPTVKNVRTNITGTLIPTALTNIYTIDIISTIGTRGTFTNQSGQAEKYVPGDQSNGTVSGNTVSVEAPTPTTPEPTTMLLFGSGLVGLGLLRKRIKS